MKRFYLSRSAREKLLLLALVGTAAIAWLFGALGRTHTRWSEWRELETERKTQQLWLGNRAAIEARAAKAVQQLDPSKTLNGTRLVGELNTLATQAGLNAEVSGQRTERTSQFAFHSAQVSFRRVDLQSLVRFYQLLSARSPYLGLEQVALTLDRGAQGTINATFRVVAAELAPPEAAPAR
ncbi:MAG TPA: hypothetical protein VFJ90_03460 [Candidatus Didemnitutus sp.]|nr:hypothetical protein [Candidatus Didemnitutus sp.]